MSDDFSFDMKRQSNDLPDFIEGKRAGVNERGERYIIVGGRRWILDPSENPVDTPPNNPELFEYFPPAPRQISLSGKLALLWGGQGLGLMTFGGIFACFGMIFVCIFLGPGVGEWAITWRQNGEATITQIENTGTSINDQSIYAYHFTGKDEAGNEFSGMSYQTADKFEEGQTVPVMQGRFFGTKRKLQGADLTQMDKFSSLVGAITLLFPTVGLCMIWFGVLWPGWKRLPLLLHGELALGTFLRQEGTNMSVNDQRVQRLVFAFNTLEGESFEATFNTLTPDKFLSDNCRKIVLYDSGNPKKNMVWESIVPMIKFNELQQRFTGFSINILIFPVFLAAFGFEVVWFFNNVITGKMFF